jgi:hypothetical protein
VTLDARRDVKLAAKQSHAICRAMRVARAMLDHGMKHPRCLASPWRGGDRRHEIFAVSAPLISVLLIVREENGSTRSDFVAVGSRSGGSRCISCPVSDSWPTQSS